MTDVFTVALDPASGTIVGRPQGVASRFAGNNSGPDLSPDGQEIVYQVGLPGTGIDLVFQSLQGSDERVVRPKLQQFSRPRFDPREHAVVVHGTSPDGTQGIFPVDRATGDVTLLTSSAQADVANPAWSRDGRTLFFERSDRAVWMRDRQSGRTSEVYAFPDSATNFTSSPSPDGQKLAVVHGASLYVVDVVNRRIKEILRVNKPERFHDFPGSLAWMPDGRNIIFGKTVGDTRSLWRISDDGLDSRRLVWKSSGKTSFSPRQSGWTTNGLRDGRLRYPAARGVGDGELPPLMDVGRNPPSAESARGARGYGVHVWILLTAAPILGCASQAVLDRSSRTTEEPVAAFVDVTVVPMDRESVVPHQIVSFRPGGSRRSGRPHWSTSRVAPLDRRPRRAPYARTGRHALAPGECARPLVYFANGVTTVRTMGSPPDLRHWRSEAAARRLLSPAIYTAGPVLDGPSELYQGSQTVATAAAAAQAVREQHTAGYDFIKVYNSLSKEAYEAIAEEARRLGMPVAGHVPFSVGLRGALAARQASIEHLRGTPRSWSSPTPLRTQATTCAPVRWLGATPTSRASPVSPGRRVWQVSGTAQRWSGARRRCSRPTRTHAGSVARRCAMRHPS